MIEINLLRNNLRFTPGQPIVGIVSCEQLPSSDTSLAVRLIFYTSGKGDRDFRIVDATEIELGASALEHQADFQFVAPTRPLSFNGKLVSLSWAIEAVALPSTQTQRTDIVISDDNEAVVLTDKSSELKRLGIKTLSSSFALRTKA